MHVHVGGSGNGFGSWCGTGIESVHMCAVEVHVISYISLSTCVGDRVRTSTTRAEG